MNSRKVAHVLRKYDLNEWGGTETHVAAITSRLPTFGWASEVHAPKGPQGGEEKLSAEVKLLRYRAFNPFLGSSQKRRAIEKNGGNIATVDEAWRLLQDRQLSLVHLHTGGRVGAAARFAMKLTRRPYVISVHGPLFANQELVAADVKRRYERAIDLGQPIGAVFGARKVLSDAARILTFNEDERRAIESRLNTPVIRMDQGVDLERIARGNAARAAQRWPECAKGPVVLLLGRLCAQKNQTLALKAFAAGAPKDHQLVLAGAATDLTARAEIDALVKELGLTGRVHILGNVDAQQEVPDLLAVAKLLIVPSNHEAFGLVALEAWAAHRPVLLARRSGLKDMAEALGEVAALAVDTLDVKDWASSLELVLRNSACRSANARAGHQLVKSRYDWKMVAGRLAEIYDEVTERTPA